MRGVFGTNRGKCVISDGGAFRRLHAPYLFSASNHYRDKLGTKIGRLANPAAMANANKRLIHLMSGVYFG